MVIMRNHMESCFILIYKDTTKISFYFHFHGKIKLYRLLLDRHDQRKKINKNFYTEHRDNVGSRL